MHVVCATITFSHGLDHQNNRLMLLTSALFVGNPLYSSVLPLPIKFHCLRKCSRGQKSESADFDETCSRSWPYWDIPKAKLFCSLIFSSKVTGGSHLGPPDHEKSCFWKGKFGPPWKQTNKALSVCEIFIIIGNNQTQQTRVFIIGIMNYRYDKIKRGTIKNDKI